MAEVILDALPCAIISDATELLRVSDVIDQLYFVEPGNIDIILPSIINLGVGTLTSRLIPG